MKTCPKCQTPYDNHRCPACTKKRSAEYYQKNKERILASVKAWRASHPEQVAQLNTQYRRTHKEEMRAKDKQWYAENKAHVKARVAQWREANKDRYLAAIRLWQRTHPEYQRIRSANRRAAKRGSKLSRGIIQRLYTQQAGLCPCCQQPLGTDFHLDHITPLANGGAHADWNVQLLRAACNIEKGARDPVEFMRSRGFTDYIAPVDPDAK